MIKFVRAAKWSWLIHGDNRLFDPRLSKMALPLACAMLLISTERSAMSEELNPVPPLAKEINETVIADATFDEQCGAYFVQMAKRQGWSIKHSLITHSDEWGRIWRADFDIKGIEY